MAQNPGWRLRIHIFNERETNMLVITIYDNDDNYPLSAPRIKQLADTLYQSLNPDIINITQLRSNGMENYQFAYNEAFFDHIENNETRDNKWPDKKET